MTLVGPGRHLQTAVHLPWEDASEALLSSLFLPARASGLNAVLSTTGSKMLHASIPYWRETPDRDRQTFSKGPESKHFRLCAMVPDQLLNSATAVQKQPQMLHKRMGLARFQ